MKRTPLCDVHKSLHARMMAFAGWEMPVQYRGVIEEHRAVRKRAGLFDVSHMGQIEVRGGDALDFCQRFTSNDVRRLNVGQAQYTLLLNEQGGVIDDLILYRLEPERWFLCVNASRTEADVAWLGRHAVGDVSVEDVSSKYVLLALQGPLSQRILQRESAMELAQVKPFCSAAMSIAGLSCLVSRTGYTGEDGFEIYCSASDGIRLWNTVLAAGEKLGLEAAGLGARDTLRLEKAYPLYGHELGEAITPLEAGLAWVVRMDKGPFVGREALLRQKAEGMRRRLVGIELAGRGIARADYRIFLKNREIGRVTSGTMSPTLRKAIALGYVASECASQGTIVEVDIRGRRSSGRIVPIPFYPRHN